MELGKVMQEEAKNTTTLNGAHALNTTDSALVDLFGSIGALRMRDEVDIEILFAEAFKEDPLLATKMAFYGRDVRGGLGERRTFRTIIEWLAINHKDVLLANLKWIPFFGRWDDLYSLVGTPCEGPMWGFMRTQFESDLSSMLCGEPVSLLAKWMKTPDASSSNTRKLGINTAFHCGKDVYHFKRDLRKLRKYLDIVEIYMSTGNWEGIEYSKVPSRAMNLYREAFKRHDLDRFESYLDDVCEGKTKINAGTLYPYDIVKPYLFGEGNNRVLNEQWKALPDYLEGREDNILVMADVSGSMTVNGAQPLASSIGLAMYFAERNKGAFHDLVMTFSEEPAIVKIKGETLSERVNSTRKIDNYWGNSTNIFRAMKAVVDLAVENHCTDEELPKAIVIVSDMEFDYCVHRLEYGDIIKNLFSDAGYNSIPNIVFWNVNSMKDTWHCKSDAINIQLVSGSSPSTFKTVMNCLYLTPYETMMKTLSDPRYDVIEVE